jgi:hypothetical protein
MATARSRHTKKTMVRKPTPRPTVTTSSYDRAVDALAAGKDVVLSVETKKRDEVRVRPGDLLQHVRIGRFAFLAYHPSFGLSRVRSFVEDEDTGFEHRTVAAALIHAVTFQSMAEQDLGPREGGSGPGAVALMANAVCRMLGVTNQ